MLVTNKDGVHHNNTAVQHVHTVPSSGPAKHVESTELLMRIMACRRSAAHGARVAEPPRLAAVPLASYPGVITITNTNHHFSHTTEVPNVTHMTHVKYEMCHMHSLVPQHLIPRESNCSLHAVAKLFGSIHSEAISQEQPLRMLSGHVTFSTKLHSQNRAESQPPCCN